MTGSGGGRRGGSAGGRSLRSEGTTHVPVMVSEVVEIFAGIPAGVVVDATVGTGGHSEAILDADPDVTVVGLDRDGEVLAIAAGRLGRFGRRARLVHSRFSSIAEVASPPLSGVLFDLGMSSFQLDETERGFSYLHDGPLDMRMDRSAGVTAAELLDMIDVGTLAVLLRDHGEARHAARLADAIVRARPIERAQDLVSVVESVLPPAGRRRGHPAKRVFQALRSAVNGESEELPAAIGAAVDLLGNGGRLVAISYHSGEDAVVKSGLTRAATGGCTCPPQLPCGCGAASLGRLLFKGAKRPSPEEIASNRRSESARLRAFERVMKAA